MDLMQVVRHEWKTHAPNISMNTCGKGVGLSKFLTSFGGGGWRMILPVANWLLWVGTSWLAHRAGLQTCASGAIGYQHIAIIV
jgi:hypothetical protein